MTRFMKIMGLCLLAAFVMSAVAVATASATKPEFRFSGTKKNFSSTSGEGKLVAKSGANGEIEIKCTSDTDTGEVGGESGTDKVTNVVVHFEGCTAKILTTTYNCQTVVEHTGLIETKVLEGELGYIVGTKKVGLVLFPKPPAESFAEFECIHNTTKIKIKVTGEVIGEITPLNSLVDPGGSFLLNYEHGAKLTEQKLQELEVLGVVKKELTLKTETSLEAGKLLASAITTEDKIFPLESTEISA